MLPYYALYVGTMLASSFNTVFIIKKFQKAAGTSLAANVLYLIVNGVISAAVAAVILLVRGQPFTVTPFSLIVATLIMLSSAADVAARLKAYEKGQIATVNVLGTVGAILLSCLWGVIVLSERLTVPAVIAIGMMLAATFFISRGNGGKVDRRLLWLYAVVIVAGSVVSILNKQHQVETRFATVDTLSFSIWIALIRTVIFGLLGLGMVLKGGRAALPANRTTVVLASVSSVVAGTCYILTLITSTVLPIVVTSPLGTGLSIIMSSVLPWLFYRERLRCRQWIGVGLSLAGAVLFLLPTG